MEGMAAEMYSIPTLHHDHVSGKVKEFGKQGPKHNRRRRGACLICAKIGYPHTRQQVLSIVQEIVHSKGIEVNVTNGW